MKFKPQVAKKDSSTKAHEKKEGAAMRTKEKKAGKS